MHGELKSEVDNQVNRFTRLAESPNYTVWYSRYSISDWMFCVLCPCSNLYSLRRRTV